MKTERMRCALLGEGIFNYQSTQRLVASTSLLVGWRRKITIQNDYSYFLVEKKRKPSANVIWAELLEKQCYGAVEA